MEAGACKDVQSEHGDTALMMAAQNGHVEIVRLLLEAGADKDLRDDDGQSARMLAAKYGHMNVVLMLTAPCPCDPVEITQLQESSFGHDEVTILHRAKSRRISQKNRVLCVIPIYSGLLTELPTYAVMPTNSGMAYTSQLRVIRFTMSGLAELA